MNCIPHLMPKSIVKFQENRVYSPQILGILKTREEPLFCTKSAFRVLREKEHFSVKQSFLSLPTMGESPPDEHHKCENRVQI